MSNKHSRPVRCVLVDRSVSGSQLYGPINWNDCVLCQLDTSEKLCCPADSTRSDLGAGYVSLADILPKFQKVGALPICLNLDRIDEGHGLRISFQKNRAKWHKSCHDMFSLRELKRKFNVKDKETRTKLIHQ